MNSIAKILLAEDEPALGQIVAESLESQSFEVIFCQDGKQALDAYYEQQPQLLVLDVMMPKLDGFSLAKKVRMQDPNIPILFLTAKSQTKDVVEGFSIGGNDYLKKPFSIEELIVRIKNLLKHRDHMAQEEIAIGRFNFEFKKQNLRFEEEEPISLTHREAHLLYHLYNNRNQVLDRSIILKKLWGDDDFFNARSMDVFISKLRKKLKKDPGVQIINVRGYGYKLVC